MSKVIFVGNDISNIHSTTSWQELLDRIVALCGNLITIDQKKPFPLLYEEIYLTALRNGHIDEGKLKKEIAKIVRIIEPNEIHEELIGLKCENYITTNYDYSLQKVLLNGGDTRKILKNIGIRKESKYSIYRHNRIGSKRFWQVHGEANVPNSITLGFEHYGGQLQQFRDYTISGTNYRGSFQNRLPLHNQLLNDRVFEGSWINFLYQDKVHIIGLKLGFEETDLWWLLNCRARFIHETSFRNRNKSKIIYYCPEKYRDPQKYEIMTACNIQTVFIDIEDKLEYYKEVIKKIKKSNP